MPVSIQLNDDLAAQLQQKAAARGLSLEKFTVHLLDGALSQMESADEWAVQNQRRLVLIHKSSTIGLCAQEQVELQGLQATLDQRLEPLDDHLLDSLRLWQSAADQLPGNGMT